MNVIEQLKYHTNFPNKNIKCSFCNSNVYYYAKLSSKNYSRNILTIHKNYILNTFFQLNIENNKVIINNDHISLNIYCNCYSFIYENNKDLIHIKSVSFSFGEYGVFSSYDDQSTYLIKYQELDSIFEKKLDFCDAYKIQKLKENLIFL